MTVLENLEAKTSVPMSAAGARRRFEKSQRDEEHTLREPPKRHAGRNAGLLR